jgi:hypothetical protein
MYLYKYNILISFDEVNDRNEEVVCVLLPMKCEFRL